MKREEELEKDNFNLRTFLAEKGLINEYIRWRRREGKQNDK